MKIRPYGKNWKQVTLQIMVELYTFFFFHFTDSVCPPAVCSIKVIETALLMLSDIWQENKIWAFPGS